MKRGLRQYQGTNQVSAQRMHKKTGKSVKLYRLPVDLRRHRNVSECSQGEKSSFNLRLCYSVRKEERWLSFVKEKRNCIDHTNFAEGRRI